MATVPPLTPEARTALEEIVSRAFGIDDGYRELNGAISVAAGFDLFQQIGMSDAPMRLIVAKTFGEIDAVGRLPACVEALFLAYPGNSELRAWVAGNNPPLLARISDDDAKMARAAYEDGRQQRRILALTNNLPAVGLAIKPDAALQALLRTIIVQLETLKNYKSVHDILHTLQTKVLVELDRVAGNVDPGERAESIADQVIELTSARDEVQSLIDEFAARGDDSENCASIVESVGNTLAALQEADRQAPLTPRRAFMSLRAMVRRHMGFFDNAMVETAKHIPFEEVATSLRGFGRSPGAPQPPPDILAKLAVTADAFQDLSHRLTRRRDVHQAWQRLDNILMNVEDLLAGSGRSDELEIHWQDITDQINLVRRLAPQNTAEVVARAQPIEVSYAGRFADLGDPAKASALKRSFVSFINGVRVQFKSEDRALLRDCRELDKLRAPLEALVEGPP